MFASLEYLAPFIFLFLLLISVLISVMGRVWSTVKNFLIQTALIGTIIRTWSHYETRFKIAYSRYKAEKLRARIRVLQQRLDNLTYEDCNPQRKSPLFNTLPGELRNEIFKWALIQYDDPLPEKRYEEDSYWYRPGFKAAKRSEIGLLTTCRMVYCECRRIVMREAEHAFWFSESFVLNIRSAIQQGRYSISMLTQYRSWARRPLRHG
jgi:hypothetical protein